jgi:tRNA pseudouridine38-40 synthase
MPSAHERRVDSSDVSSTAYRGGVLLWVAYDGTEFSGMAQQPNARTIAGELAGAIETMDPRASKVRQVSRTDAGVHAREQLVSFDTTREISNRGWVLGLTQQLPASIAVVGAATVPTQFDPRRHVISKTYRYRILQSKVRDPFLDRVAWRVDQRLNHDLMQQAALDLIGTHDFAAFRGAADQRPETSRRIEQAQWQLDAADSRVLNFDITGDRFLFHMVRIIVGTLVDIGRGRTNPRAVQTALASLRRNDLGMTAPPHGLELMHVELNDFGSARWPRVDELGSPA